MSEAQPLLVDPLPSHAHGRRRRGVVAGSGLALLGYLWISAARRAPREVSGVDSSVGKISAWHAISSWVDDDNNSSSRGDAAFEDDYRQSLNACSDYDDDDNYPGMCPKYDHDFCSETYDPSGGSICEEIGTCFENGTIFFEICSSACTYNTSSFVMPCSWQAVADLPTTCAGSFIPTMPINVSLDRPSTPENRTFLFGCDQHSFCVGCSQGNAYCRAVARYYHGVGVEDHLSAALNESTSFISASTAAVALNRDLAFWCASGTLEAIENGTFQHTLPERRPQDPA